MPACYGNMLAKKREKRNNKKINNYYSVKRAIKILSQFKN